MFWDLQYILFIGSALLVALILSLYIITKAITTPHPVVTRNVSEQFIIKQSSSSSGSGGAAEDVDDQELFPLIADEPTIELSVVIPAYNEQDRLPAMLDETLKYLEKQNYDWEIIVVGDGCTDQTIEVALKYTKLYGSNKIRILKLEENRGKGGAVRLGMQSTRGRLLLMADADGATNFPDLDKLIIAIGRLATDWKTKAICIGSRAHLEDEAIATRSFFRTILMHGFHFLVWLFAVRGIRDTQCGFKLFTRSAARSLFDLMHVEKWAFDVEILFLAQYQKIPITEIAVKWTEIDGSKVTPVWSWLGMGRDLFLIWFRYTIGAWSLLPKINKKQY